MMTKGLYNERLCIDQEQSHGNVRENYVPVYQVTAISELDILTADYRNSFPILFLVMTWLSTSYVKAKIKSMEVVELSEVSRCQLEEVLFLFIK